MGDNPSKMDLKHALGERWYVQGHNGTPLLLISAANSGFTMRKRLGFSYSAFLYLLKDDYCEMHYLVRDLDQMAKILMEKIRKDHKYLIKIKKMYIEEVNDSNNILKKI